MESCKFNINIKQILVFLTATLCSSSYSYAAEHNTGPTTNARIDKSNYLGIDAVLNMTKFKTNYGKNIFSKAPAPGINLFFRHMFNEYFGEEIGFEASHKMKTTRTIMAGNTVAGYYIDPILHRFFSFKTTFKQNYPYVGAIFKTSSIKERFTASLMLGMSISKLSAKYNIFQDDLGQLNTTKTFSTTKPICIVKLALEHKISNQFSIRELVTWKNTSKFKIKSQENYNSSDAVKLKNSFNFGIGFIYQINYMHI